MYASKILPARRLRCTARAAARASSTDVNDFRSSSVNPSPVKAFFGFDEAGLVGL
jgi:hypothetical protein